MTNLYRPELILLVVLCYLCSTVTAQVGNSCLTPKKERGVCINIKNCRQLLTMIQQKPLPPEVVTFLRNSMCGYEGKNPLVCCPSDQGVQTFSSKPVDVSNHPKLRMLPLDICGQETGNRIVGGNKTGIFQYPWMALIGYQTRSGIQYRCGGSVISDRYILTAAHCLTNLPSSMKLAAVRLGEHNLETNPDCELQDGERVCAPKPQDFTVESFVFHNNFNSRKLQDDIGLIRLNRRADFSVDTVKPICLPIGEHQSRDLLESKVVVAGWGATETGSSSPDLLQTRLPVVPNSQCAEVYKNRVQIGPKQMCAGGTQGTDSCSGDSGGPLKQVGEYDGTPRFVQFGVVSFGPKPCAVEGKPGVYTRVGYYMDWILEQMRN